MRPLHAPLLALPLIAAAIALSACAGEADEDAIRDTIQRSLTSTDPGDCAGGDTTTAAFRRQLAFGSALLAREYEKLCRAETKRLAATSVKVLGVDVDGDRAQARFSAAGGQYVFRDAAVGLRQEGDRWKLDRMTAVKLDRDAYDAQQLSVATGGRLELSKKAAGCFARRLKSIDDARLERSIVASDPSLFADPLLICFVRPQLRMVGLSNERTRCVILRLRRDARETVQTALTATDDSQGELQDLVVRAATACTS